MTKLNNVKTGHLLAFTYWVEVQGVTGGQLKVTDVDNGQNILVQGQELIESGYSADTFEDTEKVTKTRAAEILVNCIGKPFTVSFMKADNTERVLRGRLVDSKDSLLGRSRVEDLSIKEKKNRLRLVDHRTIYWIIVDNKKYEVK